MVGAVEVILSWAKKEKESCLAELEQKYSNFSWDPHSHDTPCYRPKTPHPPHLWDAIIRLELHLNQATLNIRV